PAQAVVPAPPAGGPPPRAAALRPRRLRARGGAGAARPTPRRLRAPPRRRRWRATAARARRPPAHGPRAGAGTPGGRGVALGRDLPRRGGRRPAARLVARPARWPRGPDRGRPGAHPRPARRPALRGAAGRLGRVRCIDESPARAPRRRGNGSSIPMSVSPTEAEDSIASPRHGPAGVDTIAIVLAGGEGSRLRPLTERQCKPAVPFVGSTRIVDFAIANLANSGIRRILVLAQYKPDSLVEHLDRHWAPMFAASGRSLRVVMPRSDAPADRFVGTADAVAKSSGHWMMQRPRWVAIFAADHVYRMDVSQMLAAHRRAGEGITVAAMPVPLAEASAFG